MNEAERDELEGKIRALERQLVQVSRGTLIGLWMGVSKPLSLNASIAGRKKGDRHRKGKSSTPILLHLRKAPGLHDGQQVPLLDMKVTSSTFSCRKL